MYCSRAVEPALLNPRITLSTLPDDEKTLHAEHKFAWIEYELDLAVDRYTVVVIVANVNKQYIFVKCMDYIGYVNETAHKIITELSTHPVVLNTEKQEIRSFFMSPWSDSPDMTMKEYGRQLDKRQRAAMNQGVTISDEDKTTHFVGRSKDSGLFNEELVMEWEATADRSWTVVRDIWVGK